MRRRNIFKNILESSSIKESTLEEVVPSRHGESQISRPSADIDNSEEINAGHSNKIKKSDVQQIKSVNLRPRGYRRNLRSRRNLVNTSDLISDATFEVSVAPLNEASDDQDGGSANKAVSSTRVRRFVPRSRPLLLESCNQSTVENSTFDLSVASFAGQKDQSCVVIKRKTTHHGNGRKLRSRRALVESVDAGAGNEGTFELSLASVVGQKLNEDLTSTATEQKTLQKGKRKNLRSRRALADSADVGTGNEATFEISLAVEQMPKEAPVSVTKSATSTEENFSQSTNSPRHRVAFHGHRGTNDIGASASALEMQSLNPNAEIKQSGTSENDIEVTAATLEGAAEIPLGEPGKSAMEVIQQRTSIKIEPEETAQNGDRPNKKRPTVEDSLKAASVSDLNSQQNGDNRTAKRARNRKNLAESISVANSTTSEFSVCSPTINLNYDQEATASETESLAVLEESSARLPPSDTPKQTVVRGPRETAEISASIMKPEFSEASDRLKQSRNTDVPFIETEQSEIPKNATRETIEEHNDPASIMGSAASLDKSSQDILTSEHHVCSEIQDIDDSVMHVDVTEVSAQTRQSLDTDAIPVLEMSENTTGATAQGHEVSTSVMESVVSFDESSAQFIETPKRKVTFRGRRGMQNVGDSVIQVDFARASTQTRQTLSSTAVPVAEGGVIGGTAPVLKVMGASSSSHREGVDRISPGRVVSNNIEVSADRPERIERPGNQKLSTTFPMPEYTSSCKAISIAVSVNEQVDSSVEMETVDNVEGNQDFETFSLSESESIPQKVSASKSAISAPSSGLQGSRIFVKSTPQTESPQDSESFSEPMKGYVLQTESNDSAPLSSHHELRIPSESPQTNSAQDSSKSVKRSSTEDNISSSHAISSRSPKSIVEMIISSMREKHSSKPASETETLKETPSTKPKPRRKTPKKIYDVTSEDVITPLPVSPRRCWPSPLRRSGSMSCFCPSIPAVPLQETRSRSVSTQKQLSLRNTVITGASSVSLQRRPIAVEEMWELEKKLLDTSADYMDIDQECVQLGDNNETKEPFVQETNTVHPAPSVCVPQSFSLSASCLDVTAMQDMVFPSLPTDPSILKQPQQGDVADSSIELRQKEETPIMALAPLPSGVQTRRSVQFAPTAEVLKQNLEGRWNRVSVPVEKVIDLSPIQPLPTCLSPNIEDKSLDAPIVMVASPEFPQKSRLQTTLVNTIATGTFTASTSLGARSLLTPLAVETLNLWKEGLEPRKLPDEDGLENLIEKTYSENLVPSGHLLTPQQVKAALNLFPPTGSDPAENSSPSNQALQRHPKEVTCEVDPSMVNQSQWLPPPDEGMEYDMDALSNALHYMLLGWAEPPDPVFIPLPRSAYQRRVNATPGLRRGTRVRIPTPRDSWDKVYYESRINLETGLLERMPLGYLRYPKPQEIRRRQQLLRMRKSGVNKEKVAATNKRVREARLKKLAAKRRCLPYLERNIPDDNKRPVITLESDVIWMDVKTRTLPIGHLINAEGPSEIPVIFDSPDEASGLISGGVIESISDCEIQPGLGLFRSGPLEVSVHDITNVVSSEQKRRGLHFDDKFSNLFTLCLKNPNDLDSVDPLLVVQIGNYAIPLKRAVSVLVPRGIPYKFVSTTLSPVAAHRLQFVPKRPQFRTSL